MSKASSIILVTPLVVISLALLWEATPLKGEDVIVTGCIKAALGACPPSCAADLGTVTLYSAASTAIPAGEPRSKTMFGISEQASWAVTPTLATPSGAYRVYVSMGTTYNCSADIHVRIVASSGCTLADTNYVAQSEIDTTAFQQNASLNVWTPVAVITNSSRTPTILFHYASGSCTRWYMDEVRFESLSGTAATPARITEIRAGNPLTISGTGLVSHPFALVSSTNAATPLDQWKREQTNAAGTGAFSFAVTPGTGQAGFFRVLTQ